ncbi:MmcQ/YjbR family DNA-binding protein [Nocardioides dongxiaopingii]|uniref:MmcQ/YjbR family DNA-binding protein n=1 Tax=Nocardioides dongxiaopingii TaxID=2576036 RepID=UPI001484EC53|nr:MmcQ/YjbR family DNA-binding protein [Nocardioides dongxiaopingii]
MVRGRPEPDPQLVERVARTATTLPDAYEEEAWTGVRWRVRRRTFAHVLVLTPHHVEEYAPGAVVEPAPAVVFRSAGEELLALSSAGPPYLRPPWAPGVVALLLDEATDWDEVAELVTESYRVMAPQVLVRRLDGRR